MLMHNVTPLCNKSYNGYEVFLYQSNDQVLARIKTDEGKTFEIKKVVSGLVKEENAGLIQRITKLAKEHINLFLYPSLSECEEVWVFEGTSAAAALYLKNAKKKYLQGPSVNNYTEVLCNLKMSLMLPMDHRETVEKIIPRLRQKLLLLRAKEDALGYLSDEKERLSFKKVIEECPLIDLLAWSQAWKGEKPAHVQLIQALAYELLDEPLLAADSYANLAQIGEKHAVACMRKACTFFKDTDPGIHYAHFLEKIDRTFLEKYQEFEHILLEKDAIRLNFEKALLLFAENPSKPTCFICCNPEEQDTLMWVHHVLAFDLQKIGVRPIYTAQDLAHVNDYCNFQAKIASADHIVIICTPELKRKCTLESKLGVAQEIRLASQRYHKPGLAGTTSLLYLKGDRQSSIEPGFIFFISSLAFFPFSSLRMARRV